MEQDIRLGRVAGIPVGVNWSIVFIFVLVAWELSDLVLPSYHPSASTLAYWSVGTMTTALFFVSLFAHEVSHSIVARRNGIGVRRITFWLFGGVSELEGEALTPGADFRIAAVGPLTSFTLAASFAVLAQGLGPTSLVGSAAGWLGWMNLLLGVFNLMPGAPLDGGRVLRAALWRRTGDRARAASTAARAGQVFGYLLVALGVAEFLAGALGGLWFVFLGWFLANAARSELTGETIRTSFAHVRVRDVMTPAPTTFDPSSTVAELVDQLAHLRFSTYPLVNAAGSFEGLTSIARIRRLAPDRWRTTRLIDVAARADDVPLADPDEPFTELLTRMQGALDGRALVADPEGRLVGIVSPSDVTRYLQGAVMRAQTRSTRTR